MNFFKIYFRKFPQFLLINVIYFLITLPLLAFFCVQANLVWMSLSQGEGGLIFPGAVLITSVFSFFPSGINYFLITFSALLYGPLKMGMSYIFIGYSYERHAWLSDFFTVAIKNIRQGVFFGLLDVIFIGLITNFISAALITGYSQWELMFKISLALSLVSVAFYISVRRYFFIQAISVETGVLCIIRNAFSLSLIGWNKNLLAGAISVFIWSVSLMLDARITIIFLPTLAYSLTNFISVYSSAPILQKYLIAPSKEQQSRKNDA